MVGTSPLLHVEKDEVMGLGVVCAPTWQLQHTVQWLEEKIKADPFF